MLSARESGDFVELILLCAFERVVVGHRDVIFTIMLVVFIASLIKSLSVAQRVFTAFSDRWNPVFQGVPLHERRLSRHSFTNSMTELPTMHVIGMKTASCVLADLNHAVNRNLVAHTEGGM
jgi:hypothetical protein